MAALPEPLFQALFALLAVIRHRLADREHNTWRAIFHDAEAARVYGHPPVEFDLVDYAGLVALIDAIVIECGDGSTQLFDPYFDEHRLRFKTAKAVKTAVTPARDRLLRYSTTHPWAGLTARALEEGETAFLYAILGSVPPRTPPPDSPFPWDRPSTTAPIHSGGEP